MKWGIGFLLLVTAASVAFAQDAGSEADLDAIFKKAQDAIKGNRIEEADFWLARYMGLTGFGERTERNYSDLFPLFREREDLAAPVSFISGDYADDFIDFFVRGTFEFWGIPDQGVREETFEFIARSDVEDGYFAEIIVSPYLEAWTLLKHSNATAVIPLASFEKKPFMVSGRLKDGKPEKYFAKKEIDTERNPLHYIWPVEFHDLDGDGVPEIWVRYIATWADGFSQRLDIYRVVEDEELVLLKRFEGAAEGIARRLANGLVEVGEGFSGSGSAGHIHYDKTRIRTYEYKNGDFINVDEREVPHILWTVDWVKYYIQ